MDDSLRLFRFQATLIGVSSPCLSCIEGDIAGTLDNGTGLGPDFVVQGRYSGLFDTGEGVYVVHLFRPGGTTPVGSIHGRFGDPPSPVPQLGAFGGRFRLRR